MNSKEKRCLRTTRILENCLAEKNFKILRSTKFTVQKFPELEKVFKSDKTFLVYPSEHSISLNQLGDLIKKTEENISKIGESKSITNGDDDEFFHAIILDGTWHHAESIFYRNLDLQKLKQVIVEVYCFLNVLIKNDSIE